MALMKLAIVYCLSLVHLSPTSGDWMMTLTLPTRNTEQRQRVFRVNRQDPFTTKRHRLLNTRDDRLCRRVCETCTKHLSIRWSALCWSECEHGGTAFDACLVVLSTLR
ncbi:hypothetical protein NP493_1882g00009 [Ridgeia piscesae]|uniref:Secreted protein n=1 Tax=Ridgeia piscesae TaxID=27915 RepID=A0AAD9JQG9_RIDPI|nr:hypothetical protein NP493_1882g00009 [Ridgeia piscesae]